MLNTQQTETNTEYNTNLTEEQFAQLEALTHKWNTTCKGDYESTFVGGVAHGYCDSGILTDGLSARDIDTLQKYFTGETIYSIVGIHTLQQWGQEIAQDEEFVLDCNAFYTAVEGVLTDAQRTEDGNGDYMEAALYYCWQCCE